MTTWAPDVLGDGYQQLTIPLGTDPDGEGEVAATLVRYQPSPTPEPRAVLYVHGFTDYFFQQHLAEHFAEQGYSFFALDLRKCGRSRRPGQTPHFVTDLTLYDAELDEALRLVREQVGGGEVLLVAHSTGGLILPLWLDRLERKPGGSAGAGVSGLILNSPWFDLQGPALLRAAGTSAAIDALGRVSSKTTIPGQKLDTYGSSLHVGSNGEWEYDLEWKPLTGFPIRFGWLRAIRRGHADLHHGLDIGVPSLILRSKRTVFASRYNPTVDAADAVLDVDQIARWAGCLGNRTTIVPIEGARHDVFLSTAKPLAEAFHEVDLWLAWLDAHHLDDRQTGAPA
ncbi:alpha-beta hydrolase superfamily lysophospholipase [Rhodococcus sp. OK519]|uniref:alpha/beta hydrolase n=1 Tax=Rhodococcus sp. OK519 TaxID=2135729 RepID=UPI000D40EE37|nr:alpha-beta hydrolase superfamily lysophospholipase [Rhodococcus sp. OK519]